MSSNGVTPEEPSVKSTLNAETTTSDKKEPKGSREDISKTNGEVKPALDEFGLPIRPRRQRFVTEAEDEDGESEDGEERKDGADGAKIRSNILSGQSKGSKDQEGASSSHEPEAGAVNGHKDPAETGVGAPTQAADTTTAKQENRLRADTAGSIANGVIPLSPSPEQQFGVSEWSHQRVTIKKEEKKEQEEDEWQTMPAYAPFDMYNDDNKLIAREAVESDDEEDNGGLGGAGKGYTRVTLDEDAQSATSMDDNTAYLFKEQGTGVADEDEEERDVLSQMQATKDLLTEGQRIAYVGITRLAMIEMQEDLGSLERTRAAKKMIDHGIEAMKMWGQKMMVRLYGHMEIDPAEQIMIEQLAEHGVQPGDLSPALMKNARVKNPAAEGLPAATEEPSMEGFASERVSLSSPRASFSSPRPSSSDTPPEYDKTLPQHLPTTPDPAKTNSPPPYDLHAQETSDEVLTPTELPKTENIDIDIRWTILCDLFLVLIADSVYDSRSRQLLERVGSFLEVPWIDICRFEKRVTDALEMQESAEKENWDEASKIESRRKRQKRRRLALMGLATVGGGLVIGLSAGLLAPVIGAGLAAGFTTIGVAGTSGFLAGAGGAAIVTTTGVAVGGGVGVRAASKRTGSVKTFEYRPLHNNKRTNLIITVSGWMTGKVDDVRLPFSTVDPIMGDIYSIFWEPEMLRSMGDTIGILANEALTQSLQQVLGATLLVALMSALQAPILLTKLSYLIDNPWSNSLARAHLAGLILADSLTDRDLGTRPITLVGFSLGARVIFSCLVELANKGAHGIVQNVYLFGSPLVAKKDEYLKAKSIVPGRFVNAYAKNDWILGYLFRATGGAGIMRVAGLAPVESPGIENFDVSEFVPGHMSYRAAMPRLLREVGWSVESDEFTEIEDPDPENHARRQRELINEIEEARKELEKKPQKRRWGLFSNKKKGEKKNWETYDERSKAGLNPADDVQKEGDPDGGVLFDVDAIQAEVAALAAEGIKIKEIESTLPPMKLDLSAPSSRVASPALNRNKSYNDAADPSKSDDASSTLSRNQSNPPQPSFNSWEEYEQHSGGRNADGGITMSFDTPHDDGPLHTARSHNDESVSMSFDTSFSERPAKSFDIPRPPPKDHYAPNPVEPSWNSIRRPSASRSRSGSPAHRPPLEQQKTPPSNLPSADQTRNVWSDDDDEFGGEKEMSMTFE